MTKLTKVNLFVLVKSLIKSEKRQLKLYVCRLAVNEDSKFLLFDLYIYAYKVQQLIEIFFKNHVAPVLPKFFSVVVVKI